MGGIFCRIRRQTVFQDCVVSTDGDSAAGFIKPYLGQLVFLLDSCNHFEFHLISDRICKKPVLPEKVPFKTGRTHGFSNGNAADDAEIVWCSHKKKSAKNYGLDRQTTFSKIGENTGVKRNCFLKNLRIVCRFLRMSFFYPCPGISTQRCQASSSQTAQYSFPHKCENSFAPLLLLSPKSLMTFRGPRCSSLSHISFGRSFSFQFASQLVGSEKGCKLTPSIINWELFRHLHERIFVNFL